MSNFKTRIHVDINSLNLPPGSTVGKITSSPDGKDVDVYWSNEHLKSPYTFDIDYPADQLKAGNLPEHVTSSIAPIVKKVIDKSRKKGDKAT